MDNEAALKRKLTINNIYFVVLCIGLVVCLYLIFFHGGFEYYKSRLEKPITELATVEVFSFYLMVRGFIWIVKEIFK